MKMYHLSHVYIVISLLHLGAVSGESVARDSWKESDSHDINSSSLDFFAIGDWGGVGSMPFGLTIHQTDVAVGMANVAKTLIKPEFILSLGDNFYFLGVSSSVSKYEKRFLQTFEQVYNDTALATVPWYVAAGNHDHYGHVESQIDYTFSAQNANQRWQFPALFHKQEFSKTIVNKEGELVTVTVDVVFIDTEELSSLDMGFFRKNPWLPKDYPLTQWNWVEDNLASSQADYLLVVGHYPVYSIGPHGNNPTMLAHLKPLLERYNAHHLSGHEHAMMHITTTSLDYNNVTTSYIVSGSGCWCCSRTFRRHKNSIPKGSLDWSMMREDNPHGHVKGGFTSFQADSESLKVKYHDQDGMVLYETNPISPRNKGERGTYVISD